MAAIELGGRRPEAEEMKNNAMIPSSPVRLLGGGGRRGRGGSFAPGRSAPGGFYRRRRAAAATASSRSCRGEARV